MFDIDNWIEIFSTIKKNKLRTFLTGFSISWGIFMFIILLASGNGLRNGVMHNFSGRDVNTTSVWSNYTSIPYNGFPDNRPIHLDQKDIDLIKQQKEAEDVSASVSRMIQTSYENQSSNIDYVGVYPNYTLINSIKIVDNQGRFINEMDMKERRKVAVINERVKEILFQGKNPIGENIISNGLVFKVIGVFKESDFGNYERIYIPFSTAQLLYNKGWGMSNITFSLKGLETTEANKQFEESLRTQLASMHHFDPKDERAIGMWSALENYLQVLGIFNGISAFVWIIGIGTLIAGIVGVSNIMLITVRERTKEFGIRKALGAKPSSILGLIIIESVFITSVFGYFGMFLGIGLSELINSLLESLPESEMSRIFNNPTVDVGIAVTAMLILIFSGVIAGYFPARKAVKISAVEAMRAE